jgi:ABC-2 type transport system permease protein
LFRAYSSLVRLSFKNRYFGPLSVLAEVLGLVMSLSIYFYTAKTLGPGVSKYLSPYGSDYFAYLVIGDIALLIPAFLVSAVPRAIRQAQSDGILETMLVLPGKTRSNFLLLAVAGIPREFLYALLMLILGVAVFGLKLSVGHCLSIVFFQCLAMPAVLGLGLAAAAMLVFFNRGEGVVTSFINFATVLAGAIFPLSVLPKALVRVAVVASPFSTLLIGTRSAIADGMLASQTVSNILGLLVWGIVLLPLGSLLLDRAFDSARGRGAPMFFSN